MIVIGIYFIYFRGYLNPFHLKELCWSSSYFGHNFFANITIKCIQDFSAKT